MWHFFCRHSVPSWNGLHLLPWNSLTPGVNQENITSPLNNINMWLFILVWNTRTGPRAQVWFHPRTHPIGYFRPCAASRNYSRRHRLKAIDQCLWYFGFDWPLIILRSIDYDGIAMQQWILTFRCAAARWWQEQWLDGLPRLIWCFLDFLGTNVSGDIFERKVETRGRGTHV
jgi:hypothetical protein